MKVRSFQDHTTNRGVARPGHGAPAPLPSTRSLARASHRAVSPTGPAQRLKNLSGPFDNRGRFCHSLEDMG
jgi:hypothetical protein